MELFELFGTVTLKDKGVNKGLNNIESGAGRVGKTFSKLATVIGGLYIGKKILDYGAAAVKAASDLEEMESKFSTVFGEMSDQAEEWAKKFQDDVGGSRNAIKGMIADSQDMLSGFGMAGDEAFDFSTKIQELGTDLASFQNLQGGAAEGVDRLRKGLMGETENLKAMGIVINQTVMKQKAMELGYGKNINALSEAEKMQIRYKIALEQSKNAIGDAEKTSGSFANQLRNVKGRFADITASVGKKLLPKLGEFLGWVADKMPFIEKVFTVAFDAVGKALNVLGIVFNEIKKIVVNWVSDNKGEINKFVEDVKAMAKKITETVTRFIEALKIFWEKYGDMIMAYWKTWFKTIVDLVKSIVDIVLDIVDVFSALLSGDWELLLTSLYNLTFDILGGILQLFKNLFNSIMVSFGNFANLIKQAFLNFWGTIFNILGNILGALFNFGRNIITSIWDGMKSIWTDVENWLNEKIGWLVGKLDFLNNITFNVGTAGGGSRGGSLSRNNKRDVVMDGSHANGLDSVPFDGYRAILHKKERVLTAEQAKKMDNESRGGDIFYITIDAKSVKDINSLVEMAKNAKSNYRMGGVF